MPGVYLFKNLTEEIIYVGKANSLRDRVRSYFRNTDTLLPKTAQMVTEISQIDHVLAESEIDALLLEANLIRKLKPKYNVNWKDGKAYPLIEITIKETVPQVHSSRAETNPKALYFGPYPTGGDLTTLLSFLRRIFPFVSQKHPGNRPCLRSHLGLCPCPEVFTNKLAQKKYRAGLHKLILLLKGERKTVQRSLLTEMQAAAKSEDFEEADKIKKRLMRLSLLTANRRKPWEYEANPNLVTDRRNEELLSLQRLLRLPVLHRIECYDISNTAGKLTTGAQVTFVDGVPEKNLYRRYKIRNEKPSDDYRALKEVLTRRLKSNVKLPELIVVDGGLGQLNAISFTRRRLVKVIALAKRLETIYTDDEKTINLLPDSPALHLLQRLRDEAHRFSRRYHFLLRRKSMLA